MKRNVKCFLCWLFGHRFVVGFWETACARCGSIKPDRLYQTHGDARSREITEAYRKAGNLDT